MGLRLFENDPASAPKARFADDLVGRLRSGYQVGKTPVALEKWRVTSGDPDVLDAVLDLFGDDSGEGQTEWPTEGEEKFQVFTAANSVDIILDGPDAIRSEMVLWGRSGPAIRKCDGVEQKGDDAGEPCVCPATFDARKDASRAGKGCTPSITAYFRLADAPDLGRFKFTSGSWSLARDIGQVEDKLATIEGQARATLTLEVVKMKNGKQFTKPIFKIHGPVAQ